MRHETGSALVAVFVLIAIFGTLTATILPGALRGPTVADQGQSEARIQGLLLAADEAFRNTGRYPADLDEVERLGFVTNITRIDPFGQGTDLGYVPRRGTDIQVTSRGPDRSPDTRDDIREDRDAQSPSRARTRNRLRLLRALFYRSDFRQADSITPDDQRQIREHMREIAIRMRHTYYAQGRERAQLERDLRQLRRELEDLLDPHKLKKVPKKMTGRKGLASELGLPDSAAVDGLGNTLNTDDSVGFSSEGLFRGNRDDF